MLTVFLMVEVGMLVDVMCIGWNMCQLSFADWRFCVLSKIPNPPELLALETPGRMPGNFQNLEGVAYLFPYKYLILYPEPQSPGVCANKV